MSILELNKNAIIVVNAILSMFLIRAILFFFKKHRLICRFQRKCLQIPNKKLIFAATNPTTPLNDAYHGGTSLFI